jgi:hypothetical protein
MWLQFSGDFSQGFQKSKKHEPQDLFGSESARLGLIIFAHFWI